MMKTLATVLLLLCFGLVAPARAQDGAIARPPEIDFKLKGVDGKTYDFAEMRGSVLLVSFGATWCQPCTAELRALEELKQEFKDRPVKFLWVSIENSEEITDGKLRSFAKSLKLTFPVLRDPSAFTYAQFTARRRIPLVIFIDAEGKFVAPLHAGMAEPELYKRTMRDRLNKLLQSQAKTNTTPAGAL
jgi:peroxiredoxin